MVLSICWQCSGITGVHFIRKLMGFETFIVTKLLTNFETKLMRLSENNYYFIKELLLFSNNSQRAALFSLCQSNDQKNHFIINKI